MIATVDPLLSAARKKQKLFLTFLETLVNCESPSDDLTAIERFNELFIDLVGNNATIKRVPAKSGADHLLVDLVLPGPEKKEGQVLVLAHSDTVWPLGTLARMPWRVSKGRAWGPGVLDIKGGIALVIFAAQLLRELDIPVWKRIVLQISSDEETGSRTSRALTEKMAAQSDVVLVVEPGTGLEGHAKTARKGIGDYRVTVKGIASHAGVDFEKGASAVVELARQIERIASFTDLAKGTTVNPGVISGGTRSNVIAAEAHAHVDIRVTSLKEAGRLEKLFRGLKPFDKRCSIEITGGLNRPPMVRTKAIAALFATAQDAASELGVDLRESSTGGGSDGNFTAAIGIPTLDGLGCVGEGAHASHESILLDRIPDRMALLAKLFARLGS